MNVPQAVRPNVDVARLEGEGLYPSIEGSGSASSSATASELALRNVIQTLGVAMDTDSRAKREPEADADEAPPASKAKSAPKAKSASKAKAKAQAIDNPANPEETAPPIFVPTPESTGGTGGASSSSGPADPKPKAKASGIKKTIEKNTTPKG